jgi:ribosomal protein L11 methyltransferase
LTSEDGRWVEATITVHPICHDAVSAFLFEAGCTGIVSDPSSSKTLTAYLPYPDDLKSLQRRMEAHLATLGTIFPEAQSFQLVLQPVRDENWALTWREHFHPQKITDHLIVYPAWVTVPPECGDRVIRMDPGPAFGTGKHPTTQMCLRAVEQISDSREVNRWTMLDVGTGSGILAIYAAMLGAGDIAAVDIDPEALRWAKENARLNGVVEAISFMDVPLAELQDPFTLVAANLSFTEMAQLHHQLVRLTAPGGWLVVSGILEDQLPATQGLLHHVDLRSTTILSNEEWRSIMFRKREE